MSDMAPIAKTIMIVYGFACGLYFLFLAFKVFYKKSKVLTFTMRFSLGLRSIFSGKEAAKKTRGKLLTPEYQHRLGMWALFSGIFMLFLTIVMLIAY